MALNDVINTHVGSIISGIAAGAAAAGAAAVGAVAPVAAGGV